MSGLGCIYILYVLSACLCVTSLSCGDGYFSGENKECLQCPPNCLSCDSDEDCLSCINGYWGRTCEIPCTKCKTGTSCEKTDGFCLEACGDGYSGLLCDAFCDKKCFSCKRTHILVCLKCASGRYPLSSCNRICSTCNNTACDENGVCTSGCLNGYWGETCESVCPQHCLNESCELKIGNCTHGCEGNYTGPSCNKVLGHNEVGEHRGITVLVTVASAAVVLGAVVVLVICCVKRWRNAKSEERLRETKDEAAVLLQGTEGQNRTSQTSVAHQTTPNPDSGSQSSTAVKTQTDQKSSSPTCPLQGIPSVLGTDS